MIKLVKIILVLVLALYVSRAFFVTVVMHGYYAGLATGNRVRTEIIAPPRGVISDGSGKPIAGNIEVNHKVVRYYPDGEMSASVVGYLNKDGVGIAGLEKQYEKILAGRAGERVVEETAAGQELAEIRRNEPAAGQELRLTLDLSVQKKSYQLLKSGLAETGKSGAVVVARTNGDILALVSLPSFDPNLFITDGKRGAEGGIYPDVEAVISDNERQPLFNRAISGSFAPGSVFKLVTALTGLSEKVVGRDDLIADSGEIVIGSYRYGNWLFDKYGRTEGAINIEKALARSNDIFFYKLGERIGVDRLVAWSGKLGMGQKTGIDLPAEAAGLLPTPLWMEKERGNPWFLGNTYHLAIGQGDLLATPLQINRVTAAAVSGKRCRPRLAAGTDISCVDLGISEAARQLVISGMRQACSSGGTAFPFYDLAGLVICKTGTAQHGGEKDKPHAWLTAVVPAGSLWSNAPSDPPLNLRGGRGSYLPEFSAYEDGVVVTVMVEAGGEGSEVAAPIARKIVEYLLRK